MKEKTKSTFVLFMFYSFDGFMTHCYIVFLLTWVLLSSNVFFASIFTFFACILIVYNIMYSKLDFFCWSAAVVVVVIAAFVSCSCLILELIVNLTVWRAPIETIQTNQYAHLNMYINTTRYSYLDFFFRSLRSFLLCLGASSVKVFAVWYVRDIGFSILLQGSLVYLLKCRLFSLPFIHSLNIRFRNAKPIPIWKKIFFLFIWFVRSSFYYPFFRTFATQIRNRICLMCQIKYVVSIKFSMKTFSNYRTFKKIYITHSIAWKFMWH